jgi:dipeptide transport system substrate-binding protein
MFCLSGSGEQKMRMTTAILTVAFSALLGPIANANVLTMCTEGSPEIFNPQLTNNGVTSNVLAQIYDGLVTVSSADLTVEPALAESWQITEDGKKYRFALRKGVNWQSSDEFAPTRQFNADDVVFSFKRMMDKSHPYANVSGGTYIGFDSKLADLLRSVEKVDDYTVDFTLQRRDATFLGIMAFQPMAILSSEYADTMLKAKTPEKLDQLPIGTGPFQLEFFQADAVVRLKAFHNSWGELTGQKSKTALVDNVIMAITPDASTRVQSALAGECQIALFPNMSDAETIKHSENLSLVETSVASSGFLTFNFKDPKFRDKRVREALAIALDLPHLVDIVYQGVGEPTAALIPSMFWAHNAELRPRAYDPERAKKLLTEAGFPDGFSTQVWAIPVTRPYMPNGRRAAEIIQNDWAKIGVKVEVISFEWAEYIQRSRAGEAQVGMFGGSWDYPDPSQIPNSYFGCNLEGKHSPSNIGAWCNKDFNDLLRAAAASTSQKEREEAYKRLQQVFFDEVPAITLGSAKTLTAVAKSVVGYHPTSIGTTPLAGVSVRQ